jgi:riboflavin transporter FmnP
MNVKKLVIVSVLGSISYLLMLLDFPFPGFPPFLKIDFSDIPALIAALIFGPMAGIVVELIKNAMDFVMTGSPTGVPVGHIANLVAGILFVLPTYFIFKKMDSKYGMTVGLITGVLSMTIIMSLLNYFVFLPAYTIFMGADAMSGPEARQYITFAILPFNLLKGILMAVLFSLLYSRMKTWINKQTSNNHA